MTKRAEFRYVREQERDTHSHSWQKVTDYDPKPKDQQETPALQDEPGKTKTIKAIKDKVSAKEKKAAKAVPAGGSPSDEGVEVKRALAAGVRLRSKWFSIRASTEAVLQEVGTDTTKQWVQGCPEYQKLDKLFAELLGRLAKHAFFAKLLSNSPANLARSSAPEELRRGLQEWLALEGTFDEVEGLAKAIRRRAE